MSWRCVDRLPSAARPSTVPLNPSLHPPFPRCRRRTNNDDTRTLRSATLCSTLPHQSHLHRVDAHQHLVEALQSACPAARRRRACGLAARAMCMPLLLRSDASSTCHRAEDLPDPCSSKSNSGCATVADWGTAGCVSCSSASASMLPGRTRHVQVVAAGELTFPPSPRAVRK